MRIGVFVGLALLTAVAPAAGASRRVDESDAAHLITIESGAQGSGVWQRRSTNVHYDLGVEYLLAGKTEQAISAFKRAIQANPKDGDSYFNLGNAYTYLSRWADAADAYQAALRFNRKDGEAFHGLGRAFYNLGRYAQAVEPLKRASRAYPGWAEPHYQLSNVYYKLGQKDAAAASFRQAVGMNPDSASRQLALVVTNAPANNASQNGGANPPIRNSGAAASGNEGNANRSSVTNSVGAKPTVESVRQSSPPAKVQRDEAKTYYSQGVKHGRAKRYDEAITAFQQAIRLKPDYADAHFGLAHAYTDAGRWEEAVEAYEQVLRFDPKDEEAAYRLGVAYSKLRARQKDDSANRSATPIGEKVGATSNTESADDATTAAAPPAVTTPTTLITTSDEMPPTSAAAASASPAATSRATETESPATTTTTTESVAASAVAAEPHPTSFYRVGPGDVLDVRLLSAPASQSTLYTVTAGGLLEYPLAGDPVPVARLTPEEIAALLVAELKRRAIDENPEVIVGVREYTSHNVIVSGLVHDPGTKVLRREAVPLYVIIADAQPRPEAEEVRVVSIAGQKATVSLGDAAALNLLVRPGDVITVEKSLPQFFYIGGLVSAPGQKNFRAGLTLTQAILSSGGELSRGGTVHLLRQDGKGFLTTTTYKLKSLTAGKEADPLIRPDDRIEVLQQ